MAAPNRNGRLHLTGVHQNSPASLTITSKHFPEPLSLFEYVQNRILGKYEMHIYL